MKKILLLIFLFITFWGKAQQVIPNCQPYGKIDIADLEMKSCDFEKDANAEVLIEKGDVYYDQGLEVAVEHHKRIKIFNENGKNEANIIINYIGYGSNEYITGLQGETVNLVNGKQEVTKLDKKLVYIRSVDKYRSAMVFTMPDIRAGSVIDIKYTWSKHSAEYIPEWYFQSNIPTRYSELLTHIPQYFLFSKQVHNSAPFAVFDRTIESAQIPMGTTPLSFNVAVEKRVMVDIPSLSDEPFMSSREDNLRSLDFHLTSFLGGRLHRPQLLPQNHMNLSD